ncbi:hypothetical protein ACKWTF_010754 [Chironomus riparius]
MITFLEAIKRLTQFVKLIEYIINSYNYSGNYVMKNLFIHRHDKKIIREVIGSVTRQRQTNYQKYNFQLMEIAVSFAGKRLINDKILIINFHKHAYEIITIGESNLQEKCEHSCLLGII